MSNVLFPELPGLEWDTSLTPMFNTKIMTSINGRELRASFQATPKYEISLSYAFLRENKDRKELQQLQGFYLERRGAFDSFLYKMPDDNQFDCTFIGDGTTTAYQLYKMMYNTPLPLGNTEEVVHAIDPNMWNETTSKPMWNSNTAKHMWNTTTAQITADGKYILSQPVEAGIQINIKGTYFYRCRFKDDTQQYVNFMHKLWKAGKVELIGSLGTKL
ncbi:DUF2460 domain-containing protein [Acinetobacter pittii]|uniref:DUF2460 domain-containing protein n=1 Tax=Acinetobacter pittii TaxID=48296 RepID=UPI002DBE0563|nr:DUF2460 domain-containing protein [Acinetobacter pittii]MEB6670648.1 DUF2460 domain-containing protein [Acinetobacter pittii]